MEYERALFRVHERVLFGVSPLCIRILKLVSAYLIFSSILTLCSLFIFHGKYRNGGGAFQRAIEEYIVNHVNDPFPDTDDFIFESKRKNFINNSLNAIELSNSTDASFFTKSEILGIYQKLFSLFIFK